MKRIILALWLSSLPLLAATNQVKGNLGASDRHPVLFSRMGPGHETAALPFEMNFNQTDFQAVLQLYGRWNGRTVLQHPALETKPVSLVASPTTQAEAVATLETLFRSRGISTIPDGEKFVMMVPDSLTNSVSPGAGISVETATKAGTHANEVVAAGLIDFRNLPLKHTAVMYNYLLGATNLVNEEISPEGTVNLFSVTPLTKAEVLYAIDTVLAWNNFKMVQIQTNAFRLEPLRK